MKTWFLFIKSKMSKKFDISDSDEEKNIIALIYLRGYSQYEKIHQLLIAAHKNKGHSRRNEKILQHMFIFLQKTHSLTLKFQ